MSHTVMANTTIDIFVFASTEGVTWRFASAEGVTNTPPGSHPQPRKSQITHRTCARPGTTCKLQPHCFETQWILVEWRLLTPREEDAYTVPHRTTAGAPASEEVVNQFLIMIFPSATKTVPFIRNYSKEGTVLEFSPHRRTRTRQHANHLHNHPFCTPAAGSCRTMILRWTSQRNTLPGSGCLV